jgi:hypothetical protein
VGKNNLSREDGSCKEKMGECQSKEENIPEAEREVAFIMITRAITPSIIARVTQVGWKN